MNIHETVAANSYASLFERANNFALRRAEGEEIGRKLARRIRPALDLLVERASSEADTAVRAGMVAGYSSAFSEKRYPYPRSGLGDDSALLRRGLYLKTESQVLRALANSNQGK